MKVLVTGSEGLPGVEVLRLLEGRGVPCEGLGIPEDGLTDAPAVIRRIVESAPDVVIHCAGFTDADKAESPPEKCAAVNGMGTMTVARAAARAHARMLYLSSPQVFPCTGEEPYPVSAAYGPRNVLGMSKVQAEDAVRSLLTRYYIVRADWIYGAGEDDPVAKLIRTARERKSVPVFADQVGSPTYAKDLARVMCDLILTENYGIWHARNEGYYSQLEFAKLVLKKTGISCRLDPVESVSLTGASRRPRNLRMKAELPEGIAPMPSVEDALDRYLAETEI